MTAPGHEAAALRGRELVHYMWDELEKIGTWQMSLTPTPQQLGIHAKQTGDQQRPLAYTQHLGTAAVVAGLLAAIPSAILGGPVLHRAFTSAGRTEALGQLGEDIGVIAERVAKAKATALANSAVGGQNAIQTVLQRRGAGMSISDIASSPEAAVTLKQLGKEFGEGLKDEKIQKILHSRAEGMGKGIAAAAATGAGVKALHNAAQYEIARAATQKEKVAFVESNPIAEVLGMQVESLDEKRAHGYPILQAPPGYLFNPELSAFVPNMDEQGWMDEEQVPAAQAAQQAYQQGGQDQAAQAAQQEMDQSVGQQADQMAQQQQQDQQVAIERQAKAEKTMARLQSPPSVVKKTAKPATNVTVRVGK